MGLVHFISRRARLTHCGRCEVGVLAGIDEGLPYIVDALPLTIGGELVARLQGRWTYGLYLGHVSYRDAGRMMRSPRPAVLAAHRCGQTLIAMVEADRVGQLDRLLRSLRRTAEDDDTGQRAVAMLTDLLHGRVIAEYDGSAPY